MTKDDGVEAPLSPGLHESRRWAIGIAVSIFFGVFSAVMAFLSYADRTKPAAPGVRAPAAATAPAVTIVTPDREPRNHKDRGH
jgi:hypothetical protein